MPRIEPGYIANFQTLLRAGDNGDLALLDCRDRATGAPVRVVAAVCTDPDGVTFVPLAKLFDGDPHEELDPPGYDMEATS